VHLRLDLHIHLQVQIQPQLERLFLLSPATPAEESASDTADASEGPTAALVPATEEPASYTSERPTPALPAAEDSICDTSEGPAAIFPAAEESISDASEGPAAIFPAAEDSISDATKSVSEEFAVLVGLLLRLLLLLGRGSGRLGRGRWLGPVGRLQRRRRLPLPPAAIAAP
jgi:hypothetical protein